MVNYRYDERILGATIEASILRSREESAVRDWTSEYESEGFTSCLFLRGHEEISLQCFLEPFNTICRASYCYHFFS
jgi:hypothetical protein